MTSHLELILGAAAGRCGGLPHPQVLGRHFTRSAGLQFVAHANALSQGRLPGFLYRAYVHKDVLAAIIRLDEAVSLDRVEPFYLAHRHNKLLLVQIAPAGARR